ncbi:MAG: tetraacyldisaccharide 4'-kinase, partial [Selenomonadaceae bacterium]|nr:tetraacyldisaccharide 4'-kinase [Selenomonadaceae bacterium]
DVSEFRGKHIMAVSAIGNPASFEQTLSNLGAIVVESLRYPDHYDYTLQVMEDVLQQAEAQDVEAIVVTEKDAVKIPVEVVQAKWAIPIYVICVEVTFRSGADEFQSMLKGKLQERLGKRDVREKG